MLKRLLVTALVAVVSLASLAHLLAAKPGGGGGGGGGGGSTTTETIYFEAGGWPTDDEFGLFAMKADGSAKLALPLNVVGTPSRALHGSHRWFLTRRVIEGETYPNGLSRRELFAVRDDGDEDFTVQLTDEPDLEFYTPVWAPGEIAELGMLGGLARRWVVEGEAWVINPDSVGLYTALIWFDGQGNVIGLDGDPTRAATVEAYSSANRPGEWFPDVYNFDFDWSPDLKQIVYSNRSATDLLAQNLNTGVIRTLTTGLGPANARWSPAGNLIVFDNNQSSIETIAPDGSGRKEIIRWGVSYGYGRPDFSPDGSQIVYERIPWGALESDLFRATVSGAKKVNLTSGIPGFESSCGWR